MVTKFKPLILKDYSLENKGHPSYDQEATEEINIVTELVGHIEQDKSTSLGQVQREKQTAEDSRFDPW